MVLGNYQIVDRACADGIDEVDEELDHEDGDEEGWHIEAPFDCVWARSPGEDRKREGFTLVALFLPNISLTNSYLRHAYDARVR
jgi:hypothetical protein